MKHDTRPALAQLGYLSIQSREGVFQHLAVVRVLSGFELLKHAATGQNKPLAVALASKLAGSGPGAGLGRGGSGLGLLLFDRLAFPASGHHGIISPHHACSTTVGARRSSEISFPGGGLVPTCLMGQDDMGGVKHCLDKRVIQRREHFAIKLGFRCQGTTHHRSSFRGRANKLFPPICRIADTLDVAAFLQAVKQQH